MTSLKIAFVLGKFPTISETFILNQITYLIDQGHQLTIYSRAEGNKNLLHKKIETYGLLNKTIYVPVVPKSFLSRFKAILKVVIHKRDSKFLWELIRCLNFFKIGRPALTLFVAYNYAFIYGISNNDIIHAHYGPSGLWMGFYKKLGLFNRTKIIVSFHGVDILPKENKKKQLLYRDLFKYSSFYTVNSPYSKLLLEGIASNKRKIILLPAGLDTEAFQSSEKLNNNRTEILFCGRLIKLKAPELAIQITHELIKEGLDICLNIVGDGREHSRLSTFIKDNDLKEKVNIVGEKTQQDLIEYYKNADVFLFPGIHDPFNGRCETQGLVVQEAQAMRVPVVVSDVGGVKYGMIHGITGYVVKEGNILGFVEVIKKLILSPILRKKMGDAGREYVSKNFDSIVLGRELEKIYFQAIAQN